MCILPSSPGAARPRTASTVLRNRVSQRRVSAASSTSRRRRAPLEWPTGAAHARQCAHLASAPCGAGATPRASTRGIRGEKCEPVESACAVPSGAWAPALWRASHRGRPDTTARSRRRPLTTHPPGTEPSAVRAPGVATSNCSCPSVPHARATQRACPRNRGRRHRRDDQGPPVAFVARARGVAPTCARWQSSGRSGRRGSRGSRPRSRMRRHCGWWRRCSARDATSRGIRPATRG